MRGHRCPKRRCEDAVVWFMGNNLPRHCIELSVNHRGLLREGVYGWCSVEDDHYRPRSFLIEIHNRLSEEDYLKTLFHELWHIYQYVRGDLKERRSKTYWRGNLIEGDYSEDPSEIDALNMESILYEKYMLDKSSKSQ